MRSTLLALVIVITAAPTTRGQAPGAMAGADSYQPYTVSQPDEVLLESLDEASASFETVGLPAIPCDRYARLDFLYWEMSNPHENGELVRMTRGAAVVDGFLLGQPVAEIRPGFRLSVGAPVDALTSWELSGFWLKQYHFIRALAPAAGDTLTLTPGNEALAAANFNWVYDTHGVEANVRRLIREQPHFTFHGLTGIRYIGHEEEFASQLLPNAGGNIAENFRTDNRLIGLQGGGEANWRVAEYVSLVGGFKIGCMGNFREIDIVGPTPGNGRLTNNSNLGDFEEGQYSILVDLGLDIVFDITPNIKLHAGYSGLWLTDIARAMDQLDPTNSGRNGNPRLRFQNQDIWLDGAHIGLAIVY